MGPKRCIRDWARKTCFVLRTWICPTMWTRIKHETLGIGHDKWDMVAGNYLCMDLPCGTSGTGAQKHRNLSGLSWKNMFFSRMSLWEVLFSSGKIAMSKRTILLAERLTSSKLTMPKRRRTVPVHPWKKLVLGLQSSSYPTLNFTSGHGEAIMIYALIDVYGYLPSGKLA